MNQLELFRNIFNLFLYNFLYLTDFHDIFGFLCTVKILFKYQIKIIDDNELSLGFKNRNSKFYMVETVGFLISYILEFIVLKIKMASNKDEITQKVYI